MRSSNGQVGGYNVVWLIVGILAIIALLVWILPRLH